MIIPSIDLMDGKAVQLRQGKEHVLTAERDPLALAREFNRYGEVAVIDLDAALGQGDNLDLVRTLCRVADVRVGGGIRDAARGDALLRAGAHKLIVGTAATPELLSNFPAERVMVALDHKDGQVLDHGWTQGTGESIVERANRLAPYCSGFLCTFVEKEGGMGGLSLETVEEITRQLPHPATVAGGIATTEEVVTLSKKGFDVQVGMALYTGKLDPVQAVVDTLDFEKCPLIPTIVQDTAGQVLMLAYSSPESLTRALQEGQGIYYSRSRQEIWVKGLTSGHTQTLLSCRTDCDRDALVFLVEQTGPACHTGQYSCFGPRAFSLHYLFDVLQKRRQTLPEGSYTASLFKDRHKLLKKIMEEAFEVTTAGTWEEQRWEIADNLFFLCMLAVDEGMTWADIEGELGGRHK
jgi:phosphoribosyl-ATP pyrophosphohydrolase